MKSFSQELIHGYFKGHAQQNQPRPNKDINDVMVPEIDGSEN
jgi:hypothetical protein